MFGPIVSAPAPVWITVSAPTVPASSAAAMVNGFIVEPGSNTSVSARLRIFSRATLLRAFGLYVGQFASARISPVAASRMTRPPAFALFELDRRLELAEREVLQPRVDREREVAAGLRRADRLDVLDDVAAPVDDHAAAAGLAAQPLLLRELDAFLPDVAVAGEAEDVAHRLRRRIEAPVLVLVVDALDLQRRDAIGDLRRHLPGEEDEVVARAELRREPGGVVSSSFASARAARALASTFAGNAQIDFTGVEIASGSPQRSTMRPRCAGSSISRL